MTNYKMVIGANTSSPSIILNLETTSIILGIIVSLSMLIGLGIKAVSKFNSLTAEIRDLREDLNAHSAVIEQLKVLQKEVQTLDKRFDLHVQDYLNRVEAVNLICRQLDQKIDHKFNR